FEPLEHVKTTKTNLLAVCGVLAVFARTFGNAASKSARCALVRMLSWDLAAKSTGQAQVEIFSLHSCWHGAIPAVQARGRANHAGRFWDAISAEVNRGRALGYYVERRESGAVGAFQAKTREEADKQLEETIARIAAKQAIEKAKQG